MGRVRGGLGIAVTGVGMLLAASTGIVGATVVSSLAADPTANNNNVMPLHGVPGFRLRVGDWRVLYEVDHP